MKPKDLPYPFCWEKRRVLIKNRILYIPEYFQSYSSFRFPSWSSSEVFGNLHPVHIEFCSGNGSWVAQKALENPDLNWVAVEKRFDRVRKMWSKASNWGVKNLFIVCGDAGTCCQHYLPSNTVDGIYVNFPDPWPKTRHAKHRLIKKRFLKDLHRVLKPQTPLTLVTDDTAYCQRMISEAKEVPGLLFRDPEPYFLRENDGYGTSFFDSLWRSHGKTIHYLTLLAQAVQ